MDLHLAGELWIVPYLKAARAEQYQGFLCSHIRPKDQYDNGSPESSQRLLPEDLLHVTKYALYITELESLLFHLEWMGFMFP